MTWQKSKGKIQEGLDQILFKKKFLDHISQKHDESLRTPYLYSKIFNWINMNLFPKRSQTFMAQQKPIIPGRRFLGCICEWPTCTTGHLDFRILRSSKTWKIERWVLTNVSYVKSYPSYPQTKNNGTSPELFFFKIKNSSFSSFFYRYNKKVETHDLETLRDKKKAPWPNQGASRWDSPNGLHLGPHRGDSDWSSSRDVQQWSLATRYQVRFFFCWERWRWTQVVNPKHFFFLKELVIFSFFSAGICFGNLP